MKKNTSSQYKYQNLKEYLMGNICSGAQENGGRLESEPQLCKRFNLSRNTTRQALQELESEGYIYRIHGKGTFIRAETPVKSHKIALLIYDTAYMAHPVTGALIRGIDEVLSKNGYFLDILASKRSFHEENLSRLAENYAGFLVGTYQLDELTLRELEKLSLPHLFVKNYLPGYENKAIRIDFHQAGFLAAEHLILTGRRNLALVYSGDEIAISREFKAGVVSAALEYGVKLRHENILTAFFSDHASVPAIAEELLKHTERPDGIICASDELGATMVMELKKRGVAIPGEIAVIGCNNTEMSQMSDPALTTIDIHIVELGRRSASLLLKMDGTLENPPELLKPTLVIRSSTNTGKGV